ncbi:hypothetical protein D3C72_2582520 [compost metagenome]
MAHGDDAASACRAFVGIAVQHFCRLEIAGGELGAQQCDGVAMQGEADAAVVGGNRLAFGGG